MARLDTGSAASTHRLRWQPRRGARHLGACPCRHLLRGAWYRSDTVLRMAMTLRTDDELERALEELAAREGLSKQEVIRRAILDRYARSGHRDRVEQATEEAIERWGDVLDRLGSV